MMRQFATAFFALSLLWACKNDAPKPQPTPTPEPEEKLAQAPTFIADSAYAFVKAQLAFGPRVPETQGHEDCANWLIQKFESYGTKAHIQTAEMNNGQGKTYPIKNIVAQINPQAKTRILLAAHWDTRAMADRDSERQSEPIPGADDGASGVAVLLEISRQIQKQELQNVGVDIVLFDVEDQGLSGDAYDRSSWCLGAQHWSRNPHTPDYKAKFGILLDMVGARAARFPKEGVSLKHAAFYVDEVWQTAWKLGYNDFFVDETHGQLVDDHLFVNEIRKIPMLDIINLPKGSPTGFGPYWHTHQDDIDIISPTTLKAVGQTVLQVIYQYEERGK
ncbi:M28 family peptidase [Saprospira grandis]|uniref:Peptidase M28 n=1 Tax=Saprospira grandis (strain Lewin) TaxID=984262 RepID=H6L3L2_SAPGL|nr:M28 family peptidase [Saprospira grandis]AFC24960.1 peptidase M28 [Saprospira grandis str. Lewin]